ncbi:MAG TPA: hypothetical protein VLA97_01190 [Nocardioidaceae bacterium]|nr:hypothetical protein [Nocardioidaceae bacterium]HSE69340.1 hypothetical protein [Nocardioidaceae bacterium]
MDDTNESTGSFEAARTTGSTASFDAGVEAPERTGNPVVDTVLDSLTGLDDTPVPGHVPVFEAAHEQLRAALADAGNQQSS